MGRVKGHCIAFVRSALEVTLGSGPSCCRQLGHATYIESNYPLPANNCSARSTAQHTHHNGRPILVSFLNHTLSHSSIHQDIRTRQNAMQIKGKETDLKLFTSKQVNDTKTEYFSLGIGAVFYHLIIWDCHGPLLT